MNKDKCIMELYVAPVMTCMDVIAEGMLCTSPVDPGYGGGEDMEEGDEL